MKDEVPAREDGAINLSRKEVLTTGQVARICHVAPRTVSKWFDSGKLRGYRIPGSRDRRIPMSQLLAFMRMHGMPLTELEGLAVRVLMVEPEPGQGDSLAERLARLERYEVRTAATAFEAGVRAGHFQPHVILLDVVSQKIDAAEILRNVRADAGLSTTKVVAVAGALTRGQKDALLRQGFDAVLSRPLAIEDVVGVVEETAPSMA